MQAIKRLGFLPDVIYDLDAKGRETMIHVPGRDPREVWGKVKRILE